MKQWSSGHRECIVQVVRERKVGVRNPDRVEMGTELSMLYIEPLEYDI